ncbi:leucine-rich repeat domain-containing protein, partial [Agathobacter sp.]|uniref:leucine-rich repeat domain-containing protein n=1 Tax=Agathobacter sp. TaxID=2021311 RepID=UPI0027D98364
FIALNNTENNNNESKDIEIVDNDEIMIYKLTADNVNSINEKISKYRNIIRIRIFCLQDNDIDLSLLNKLELQFSDVELNVYIDSNKSLKGLNKIDGTIDLNIYGTDKQKIYLSDLNNVRFLQIRSCTIDDKSGWGNMTNLESAILYSCILKGFGDCSRLDKLDYVRLERNGCNSDDAANFSGLDTLNHDIQVAIYFDVRCKVNQECIDSLENANIHQLDISGNQNLNLSIIKNLNIISFISGGEIDWNGLQEMPNLKKINIRSLNISDLTPVASLTNIEELDISNTNVTDLSPLKDMPNLKKLIAENCNIDDWSPVSDIDEVIK